jgi:hypothetical protein
VVWCDEVGIEFAGIQIALLILWKGLSNIEGLGRHQVDLLTEIWNKDRSNYNC